MSKRAEKAAEKQAAYDAVMAAKERPSTDKSLRRPRWVRYWWDKEKDCLVRRTWIGAVPRPGPDWHREGSIDELEARENAGQREMFE
ncbi:hypothetical protein AGR2A_Cc70057 [Agrobacterium genomosp. 2 str. CFBP 5494]|uniref:Uncharacterized protein n=1 Tax=Agrobacterium genomosp. 2 str. CFBP 5494 TaxID=1183436 RepID=A0A9W5F376_9HYPH|nr:hypothetical protein AGR2A_Cc70057 [Agrobacterium genomosp. 2 str. CFBP 5494]